jgi:hypothetical protein
MHGPTKTKFTPYPHVIFCTQHSIIVFFISIRSLKFNQRLNQNDSTCSSVFYIFLYLLTPINFRLSSIQSNFLNFDPTDFHFPSGFPRNTFYAIQYYIYFAILKHTSYRIKTITFLLPFKHRLASTLYRLPCHIYFCFEFSI